MSRYACWPAHWASIVFGGSLVLCTALVSGGCRGRGPLAAVAHPPREASLSPGWVTGRTVLPCYLGIVTDLLDRLARCLVLGALLEDVTALFGGYELVAHWLQGEFHHDLVLRLPAQRELLGPVLVVATNCNGGIKEVLSFASVPNRSALWHHRCPHVSDFAGELGPVLGRVVTEHWFDPCELLAPDARSELRSEFRRRQEGGGWEYADGEPPPCHPLVRCGG